MFPSRMTSLLCACNTGTFCTVCVKSDGAAWSFGFGLNGRLGHGDTANQLSPKSVAGLSYSIKLSCLPCPRGKFQQSSFAFSCLSCVAGKWSSTAGLDDAAKCIECEPGRYSPHIGQSSNICINCAAGKWSSTAGLDDAAKCIDCEPGRYMLSKEPCSAGKGT